MILIQPTIYLLGKKKKKIKPEFSEKKSQKTRKLRLLHCFFPNSFTPLRMSLWFIFLTISYSDELTVFEFKNL